jgi:hypothetical protein
MKRKHFKAPAYASTSPFFYEFDISVMGSEQKYQEVE